MTSTLFAKTRDFYWVVDYKTVQFAGVPVQAMAINQQIPAPLLQFNEGDRVRIHVENRLKEETAIHWHGLIVPWQMDGVLGVSQQGIAPGQTFHYELTVLQSGTYWYHAHAGLQEQLGLYGGIVITPQKKPSYHDEKDYTIILSDWSDTHPDHILANLKKAGDYYAPRFPLQPSLLTFIRDWRKADASEKKQLLDDYQMMQLMRMSIYDISDVAYDAFLLNGHTKNNPWTAPVAPGQTVRLRLIGAAANTLFRFKIPHTSMQVVSVDGNEVAPYSVRQLTIAPGETWDVRIRIERNAPYILYAESADTVGAVYGLLTTKPNQHVDFQSIQPFPTPLPVTRDMMDNMMASGDHAATPIIAHHDHHMQDMAPMNHDMTMPMEPMRHHDTIEPPSTLHENTTPDLKYHRLIAQQKTNDPQKPIAGVIHMELFGYMDRFIWFINGKPEYEAQPIILLPNQRYRIIFNNTSMMHHPMHIHGHWFILRQGLGAYDPLLHTIDVAPGAQIVTDIDTDASGQWIFHCHFLYHMMSGMSRVIQYQSLIELVDNKVKPQHIIKKSDYRNRPIVREDQVRPIHQQIVHHPMPHRMNLWFSHALSVAQDVRKNVQRLTYQGLYGGDFNKLEVFINDAELHQGHIEQADADIFYWHLMNQFWVVKGGMNYHNRPARTPYWQPGLGIFGLAPYYIGVDARAYYYSGAAQLDLELSRDTQITNNFFIGLRVRGIAASKTVPDANIGQGLSQLRFIVQPYYRLMPGLNLYLEYENERYYGALAAMHPKQQSQNTLMLGFAVLM